MVREERKRLGRDRNSSMKTENSDKKDQQAIFESIYRAPKYISPGRTVKLKVKSDISSKKVALYTDIDRAREELRPFLWIRFDGRVRPNRPLLTFSLTLWMYRQGYRRISHINYDRAKKRWREYQYGVRDCANIRPVLSNVDSLSGVLHQVASLWHIQNIEMLDVSDLEYFIKQRRFVL